MFTDFFGLSRKLLLIAAVIVLVLAGAGFLIWRTKTSPPVTPSPLPSLPAASPLPQSPTPEASPAPAAGKIPPYQGEPVSELNPDPNFLKQVSEARRKQSLDELKDLADKLAQNPNQPALWSQVAYIKHFYNDYGGVRDAYEYLNVIAENDPIPFYNLANLYGYDLKQPAKAVPKYKEAIRLNSLGAVYYIGFAGFYQDVLKDMKSAEEVLLSGEKKLPSEPAIAVALGSLYEAMGRVKESIARYEKALRIGGYTKDEAEAIKRAIERVSPVTTRP